MQSYKTSKLTKRIFDDIDVGDFFFNEKRVPFIKTDDMMCGEFRVNAINLINGYGKHYLDDDDIYLTDVQLESLI